MLRRTPSSHISSWKSPSLHSSVQLHFGFFTGVAAMGGMDVGGVGDDGDGGCGGETSRLMLREDSSLESPSVPRKTSGAASSSSATDGGATGISAAATVALFLERTAALWLTLEAASAVLARFVGCARVAVRAFKLAATEAAFTVLVAAILGDVEAG